MIELLFAIAVSGLECKDLGQVIECNDGTTYAKYGNAVYGSLGDRFEYHENTIRDSTGTYCLRDNDNSYCSDGLVYKRIDNRIYGSDASLCIVNGDIVECI